MTIVITTLDKLPEYCYGCPCRNGDSGYCQAEPARRYNTEYRPFWCPLEEAQNEVCLWKE